MARVETRAVCLRHWPYSETSQTVVLLGETTGLVRVLAKGAKRDDPRFSGGFELTDVGLCELIVPDSGALATAVRWDLERTFPGVRRDLGAFEGAMFAIDLVSGLVGEMDPHPVVFEALVSYLERVGGVSGNGQEAWAALAAFEWLVLSDAGYRPLLDGDAVSGRFRFSPGRGGIVGGAEEGEAVWEVRASTVSLLRGLARGDVVSDGEDGEGFERVAALLAAYAREVLGRDLACASRVFVRGLPRPRDLGG